MRLFAASLSMWPIRISLPALKPETAGLLAIALAALLWAIAAVVARKLLDAGVTPFELALSRAAIATVGLGVICGFSPPPKQRFDGRMLLLGLALALVTACYYVAIARLSVAVAIVIQYTAPALVVLWSAVKNWRLPAPVILAAVSAALLGVSLISGVFSKTLHFDGIGLIAAGGSAVFFATYTLFSEALVDTYGATGVMFRGFLVATLFWSAFQVSQGVPTSVLAIANGPGLLFTGIGGTLIPFSLMVWGIQRVKAERGAIAASLEPVLATLLAWVWLGQTLNSMQILGGMLVLGAVLLLQVQPSDA